MKKQLSIYIHWPWCLKKCPYCDFNSHTQNSELQEQYMGAMIDDLNYQKQHLTGEREVVSIFFGGGTPSLMKPEYVERILNEIAKLYSISADIEISLEANPTSSTYNKFKGFKQAGINRLSIGVQSFNDKNLQFLGRQHNGKEAIDTIKNATNIFNNVNIDLIYTLPEQTLQEWEKELNFALQFQTQHISAYQLTVEKNTQFFSDVRKNKWTPMDPDTQTPFFNLTRGVLISHNYENYEISNFATKGYICIHNNNIWNYQDYMGIGSGSHGRINTNENNVVRTQNYKIPTTYTNHVKRVKHGLYEKIELDTNNITDEKILMGLRTQKGIKKDLLERTKKDCQQLAIFKQLNMLQESNGYISTTKEGMLLLDSITEPFILNNLTIQN